MAITFDFADELITLVKTMGEGLEHLNKRMGELHFEDTRYLFEDIVAAYRSVMITLEDRFDKIVSNNIIEKSNSLQGAFEKLQRSYEDNKIDLARMDMQFVLIPAFKVWVQEIETCFKVSN